MNTLVSDPIQQQQTLSSAAETMRQTVLSVQEREAAYEKQVNKFLDYVLSTKKNMAAITESTQKHIEQLSGITWFTEVSEEILKQISEIIKGTDELANLMVRVYAKVNTQFHKHGIDKTELRAYKVTADDLKEMGSTLNDRFFVDAQDAEMLDLMRQLHDIA